MTQEKFNYYDLKRHLITTPCLFNMISEKTQPKDGEVKYLVSWCVIYSFLPCQNDHKREVNFKAGLLPFRQSLAWADSGCETNYRRKLSHLFILRVERNLRQFYERMSDISRNIYETDVSMVLSVILFCTDDPISNIVLVKKKGKWTEFKIDYVRNIFSFRDLIERE